MVLISIEDIQKISKCVAQNLSPPKPFEVLNINAYKSVNFKAILYQSRREFNVQNQFFLDYGNLVEVRA